MKTYRLKVWTGPTLAVEIGRKMRRAGLKVPITGTEHVYVNVRAMDCAGAKHNMRAALYRKYKTDWSLRATSCSVLQKRWLDVSEGPLKRRKRG